MHAVESLLIQLHWQDWMRDAYLLSAQTVTVPSAKIYVFLNNGGRVDSNYGRPQQETRTAIVVGQTDELDY